MISNSLFYCESPIIYPPFKNGLYLEEYFMQKYLNDNPYTTYKYIPALWTNFQLQSWFNDKKHDMQKSLDEWVHLNPNSNGYFIVYQADDAPLLKLPHNTLIFGSCMGNIPIPLIYEDKNHTLENAYNMFKNCNQKWLCSFIGSKTSYTRVEMYNKFVNNNKFYIKFKNDNIWNSNVSQDFQRMYIKSILETKYVIAPRGYGRASFRFYEAFLMKRIPIYIWDDEEWLPFKDKIDYSKFCISLHISQINKLEYILDNINKDQYISMLNEYDKIKHLFTLDGVYEYIINSSYVTSF